MRLLRAAVDNFCSYKHLEFSFDNQGLALLYGTTGAGKSTILDIPTFILFGQTAKGGKVDDVIPWGATEPTVGTIEVETQQGTTIKVTRIRGAGKNDLFFEENGEKIRGKDISDTQRIINAKICTDFSTYTTGAYLCDASASTLFFIAPAKARRELFEKITDLSLPAKLSERVQNAKKITKKNQADIQTAYDRAAGKIDSIGTYLERVASDSDTWDRTHTEKLQKLQVLKDNFDKEKTSKIEVLRTKTDVWDKAKDKKLHDLLDKAIPLAIRTHMNCDTPEGYEREIARLEREKCKACGGPKKENQDALDKYRKELSKLEKAIENLADTNERIAQEGAYQNPYTDLLNNALTLENHYVEQLTEEMYRVNPYDAQWKRLSEDWAKANEEYLSTGKSLSEVTRKYKALTHLQDLASDLRGALLKSSVSQIEAKTNDILQTYFDGAFRVGFTVSGDDLDISIQKSGHDCTYLQLSKGQRRLLTLSFSVAIMEATANNLGIHFDCLMLDEPTDGTDGELKLDAYRLFEDLASKHSTVLVIDHDKGLQNQFDKKFRVEMVGDHSELEEE